MIGVGAPPFELFRRHGNGIDLSPQSSTEIAAQVLAQFPQSCLPDDKQIDVAMGLFSPTGNGTKDECNVDLQRLQRLAQHVNQSGGFENKVANVGKQWMEIARAVIGAVPIFAGLHQAQPAQTPQLLSYRHDVQSGAALDLAQIQFLLRRTKQQPEDFGLGA
jgi:hypothetical protein